MDFILRERTGEGKGADFPRPKRLKMKEEWQKFEPPFDGYRISNYGRIINSRGWEIKPYCQWYRGWYTVVAVLTKQKDKWRQRKIANIGVEVYKRWGKGYRDGVKVRHKDGNKYNNSIDNLEISEGYTKTASPELVRRFEREARPCILHYLQQTGWTKSNVVDLDDVIQGALLLIWLHLPQFEDKQHTIGFYRFCMGYTRLTVLAEYKRETTWRKKNVLLSDLPWEAYGEYDEEESEW